MPYELKPSLLGLDHRARDQLLFTVASISALIPDIPHVVIILFGPQGSGKTWALRAVRAIVDPSILDLLALPRAEDESRARAMARSVIFFGTIAIKRSRSWSG